MLWQEDGAHHSIRLPAQGGYIPREEVQGAGSWSRGNEKRLRAPAWH